MTGAQEKVHTAPVVLLQVFAITLFAIPSNYVILAVGAPGYVASLVGLLVLRVVGSDGVPRPP